MPGDALAFAGRGSGSEPGVPQALTNHLSSGASVISSVGLVISGPCPGQAGSTCEAGVLLAASLPWVRDHCLTAGGIASPPSSLILAISLRHRKTTSCDFLLFVFFP